MAGLVLAALILVGCRSDGGGPEPTQFPALPDEPPAVEGVVYGVGRPDEYYGGAPDFAFKRFGRVRRVDLPSRALTTFASDASSIAVGDGRLFAVCCPDSGPGHLRGIERERITDIEGFSRQSGIAAIGGGRFAVLENANPRSGSVDDIVRIRDADGTELKTIEIANVALAAPTDIPGGGFSMVVEGSGGDDEVRGDRAILLTFSAAAIPIHETPIGDLSDLWSFSMRYLVWPSSTGLVAVTGTGESFPPMRRDTLTTVIANAFTGQRVQKFEGWIGGAWSPDGTALLLARSARTTGSRTTELAMAYGPKLGKFKSLGVVEGEFVPMRWLAAPLPGA